jgi:dTDP-4-amino-4,6-dideoxygalactose transaminase
MIKFLDLHKQYKQIKNELNVKMEHIHKNSSYINGKFVSEFEESFSSYLDCKHCIGVGNGTDALEIAIKSLDIKPGNNIIVPANSFIASAEAVSNNDLEVNFCDVDPREHIITIENIKSVVNKKTKAIIYVSLYGYANYLDEIKEYCNKHNIYLIEDCAQSHGSIYKDRKVGSWGDISAFSFYPGKTLGAFGDGGAIITNDDKLAKSSRMIANHGRVNKYDHEFVGRNSRLDTIQSAVLLTKLNYLDHEINKRQECARHFEKNLANDIPKPIFNDHLYQSFHLYVIQVNNRDIVQQELKQRGIPTGVHYPISLPNLKAYANHGTFPISTSLSKKVLSLPIGSHLSAEDLENISTSVNEVFKKYNK